MPVGEVVLLVVDNALCRIAASNLAARFPDLKIIVEQHVPRRSLVRNRIRRFGLVHAAGQLAFIAFSRCLRRAAAGRIAEIIAAEGLEPRWPRGVELIEVTTVNSPDTIACLQGLVETGLKEELALGRTEGTERLANSIARPALNVRGIRVGDVGAAAANAIATEARASLDFRLVPDQTPQRVRERTEAFLRAQGWQVVESEPDAALRRAHPKVVRLEWDLDYPGYRADMNAPAARAVVAAIERATGGPVLRLPMLGGSVPMRTFADALKLPIIGVPLANYDNNQHAANENLRLQNLWDGIDIYAGLLTDVRW